MKNETTFVLERAPFKTKDGREMFNYFVRYAILGKEYKADFEAKDQGGYELLDLMFSIKPTAELVMWEEAMTDDRGNVTMTGNTYGVKSVDEDGVVYECKIKPFQESDKALLAMLLK